MLKSILSLCLAASPALRANPPSVLFDFNSNTGKVSQHTFPSGVKISPMVIGGADSSPTLYASFTKHTAKLSAREPNHTLSFTVSIDAATSISLDQISFDYGFNEEFHPNAITPSWSLQISQGQARPPTGSLTTISRIENRSRKEKVKLNGLKNLNNTEVTFTLTFKTKEKRNSSLNRAHIIDNLTISGSSPSSSKPSALLGIGGVSLIYR